MLLYGMENKVFELLAASICVVDLSSCAMIFELINTVLHVIIKVYTTRWRYILKKLDSYI